MALTSIFKQKLVAFLNNRLDSASILLFSEELEHVDQDELISELAEMGIDDDAWRKIAVSHQPLWDQKLVNIWENIASQSAKEEMPTLKVTTRSSPNIWYWLAAVLLAATFVGYQYLKHSYKEELPSISPAEIYASQNISQITLPDGRVLIINDSLQGLVYEEDQFYIRRTATGELQFEYTGQAASNQGQLMNAVQTSKGGFTVFQLEDGTKVHLNSESSLRFPLSFRKDRREVHLVGEGYFEVVKNKAAPFIVNTDNQQVEVLGTVFNMRSYPNENKEATTLISGSVKIHNERLTTAEGVILKPGEQALISSQGLQVQQVNIDEYTGWVQKRFVFSGTALALVLMDIERWYDVEFVHEGAMPAIRIEGNISKDVPLERLLKVLEMNTKYTFSMKGRRVFMNK